MSCCTSCGLPIPDGQGCSCSMCYGDIGHGRDGYYQAWAEQQMLKEAQDRQEEAEYDEMIARAMESELKQT